MESAVHTKFDVLIIGGGVIGLSIARELHRAGVKRVGIIEPDFPGNQASAAAAGMLAPQTEANGDNDFFRLCQQSRDLYPRFAAELLEETGIDLELEQTGTLYLAFDDADLNELEHRWSWQTTANLAVEKLDVKQVLELEPNVSPEVLGGLRFPLDWQVQNKFLISALIHNLQLHSRNKRIRRQFEKIRQTNGAVYINAKAQSVSFGTNKKPQVTTDLSRNKFFYAATVIIASGAWTSTLSLPPEANIKVAVEPVRGQIISFNTSERLFGHVINTANGYVVPRLHYQTLVGATVENAGFERYTTGSGIVSLLKTAFEISAKFQDLRFHTAWAGLRPKTPDGLPLLGEYPANSNLYWATGHYRNGILLAPITGKLIADKIARGIDSPYLHVFNPSRFEN